MVNGEVVAWSFLGYLLVPLVAFAVWWLVGAVRRKIFKKTETMESEE